jgi:hypothetical protein
MQAISATDAITSAIGRTKDLLFRPFQWGSFLKLCAVAVFTEGLSGNFNFNVPHHDRSAHIEAPPVPFHLSPAAIAGLVALFLSILIAAVLIYYVVVRLRFALFDCLIHQTRQIRPGWRLYRAQARRYFLLSMVVGIVFCAVSVAICLPFVFGALRLYHEYKSSGHFPIAGFLAIFLPLLPVILLVILAAVAVNVVLRDFMLPHIALENASASQAWAVVRARIAREKGAFLLYTVLRVFLPAAALVALLIALAIPCLILFGILVLVVSGLHGAFNHATGAAWVLGVCLKGLIGLAIAALGFLLIVSFGGPLSIAIRNYALVFYGGRYPALGDILFPPPALTPSPATEPGIA